MHDASEQNFLKIISGNKYICELLESLPGLNLPDWYLVGGCLFQTVWNELSGYPPEYGMAKTRGISLAFDYKKWKGRGLTLDISQ